MATSWQLNSNKIFNYLLDVGIDSAENSTFVYRMDRAWVDPVKTPSFSPSPYATFQGNDMTW